MAVLNGEKIFNDVRDGIRDISKLSRNEVLAAKTYIATRNRKTYSTEQPLGATEAGQKKLAAQNAALPPTSIKPQPEAPKGWGQTIDEALTNLAPDIYPAAKKTVGDIYQNNPFLKTGINALGAVESAGIDVLGNLTNVKDPRLTLNAPKQFVEGAENYLRNGSFSLNKFPNFADVLGAGLENVNAQSKTGTDIAKNIYAAGKVATGTPTNQAVQDVEAWARNNPKLAGIAGLATELGLGLGTGAIGSKIAKTVGKIPTPSPKVKQVPTQPQVVETTLPPIAKTKEKPKPPQRRYPGELKPVPRQKVAEPPAIVNTPEEPNQVSTGATPNVLPVQTSVKPEPPIPTTPTVGAVLSEPPVTPKTPSAVLPKPQPNAPTPVFRLPSGLTKSNPRYSYGDKKFEVTFDSDLDKALYIIAGNKKSKAHDKFMELLIKHTGLSESELKSLGQQVRQAIKDQAKGSPAGVLRIKETGVLAKQVSAPTPTIATSPKPTPTTAPTATAPKPVATEVPKPTVAVAPKPAEAPTLTAPEPKSAKKLTPTESKKLNGYIQRISSGKANDILDPDEAKEAVSLAVRKGIIEPEYATKPVGEGISKIKVVSTIKPSPTVPTKQPTIPKKTSMPKDSTLTISKHVQPEVANIAQQWKRMMGITENLLIVTPNDLKDFAKKYPDHAGHLPSLQKANRDSGLNGMYSVPSNRATGEVFISKSIIFIKPQKSVARTLELLSHEMGHMLMEAQYKKAPKHVQDAIDAEYIKWYQKNKAPTTLLSDLAKNLRAYKASKSFQKQNFPIERLTKKERDYYLGKDEWFADQVARWATTTKKPLTVVEKFFARLAKVMKEFFQINKEYLPTKTMKDWLDGLEKSAKNNTKVADKSDKSAVGDTFITHKTMEIKSKNPKIESILTATKPTERFKEKINNTVTKIKDQTLAVFKAYSKLSESQREKFFKGKIKLSDAGNSAIRSVDEVTAPLKNPEEFDAFRRIVILRDLYQTSIKKVSPEREKKILDEIAKLENDLEDLQSSPSVWKDVVSERIKRQIYTLNAELKPILPEGVTTKEILRELNLLETKYIRNQNVVKALNNYKAMMKEVFDELVSRGKLSPDNARTDYYPHRVLDSAYALDFANPNNMSKGIETPYRYYTQKRVGSLKNIDTDFEQVLTDVLTKINMDNAIDDLASSVVDDVDILQKLTPAVLSNPNQRKNVRRAQVASKIRVTDGKGREVRRSVMENLNDKIVEVGGEKYRFYSYGDKIHLIPENLYNELKQFRGESENIFLVAVGKATSLFKGSALTVSGAAYQTMNLLSGITNLAAIDPKALLNVRRATKILLGSNSPKLKEGVAKLVLGQEKPDSININDIDENIRAFAIDNGIIEPINRPTGVHRFTPTWKKIVKWANPLLLTRNVSQVSDEFLRLMKLIADYDRALDGKPPVTRSIIKTDGLDIEQEVTRTAHEFFINPKRQSKTMQRFASQLLFPFINWAANSSVQTARYIRYNPVKSAIAFLAIPALLETWNNTGEREQIEKLLSEDKRKIPHIITDVNSETGKPVVLYFNFLPGLSFFDLTNLDYIPQNVSDAVLGRKTAGEALGTTAKKAALAPVDVVENFITPFIKTPLELGFNKSAYTGREIIPSNQKGTTQGFLTGLEYALKGTVPAARAYSTSQSKIESEDVTKEASIGESLGKTLSGIANPFKQIYKEEDRKKLEESAKYRQIEKGTISANKQKEDILKDALIEFYITQDGEAYRNKTARTNLRGAQIKAYANANRVDLLKEAIRKTNDPKVKERLKSMLERAMKKEEDELSRRAKRANQ